MIATREIGDFKDMTKDEEEINVIYIVGLGHSGSTLLDLIIGSSKKCIGLGELDGLREFIRGKGESDRGNKAAESKFWSPVAKKFCEEEIKPYNLSMKKNFEVLLHMLLGFPVKDRYKTQKLFKKIFKRAKEEKPTIKYILDSSKDERHLVYLNENENINVKVIHLIRDGRGVVNSHERRGLNWFEAFSKWLLRTLWTKLYLNRIDKERKITVSYDLFAQKPKKYIKKINKEFNLDINEDNFIEEVNKEPSYRFAGNAMRNKEKRKKMGREGRKIIEKKFDIKDITEKYLNIYKEVGVKVD